MDASDRDWKERFAARPKAPAGTPCPAPEIRSTWAAGPLSPPATVHLAECADCREELVEVRRLLAEKGRTEAVRSGLRTRLHGLTPRRALPVFRIAAAAVAVFAIVLAFALGGSPPPAPVAVQPVPKPKPKPPVPEPQPVPTPETPRPEPKPDAPSPPAPTPEKPPAPEKPAPRVETPVLTKPDPAPEKLPTPIPEKPTPAPTRAKAKGTLLAVSGTGSIQGDGDAAWQSLRVGQGREFMGTVRMKTDVAAAKVRLGAHTCYLQRGAELTLSLEEGRSQARLAKGEAFFDITPGREAFEVETPHGLANVTGTRFLVAIEKNETEVVVQRGSVDFAAGAMKVSVGAGERSVAAAAPQKADLAKRLAWLRALEDSIWIEAEQMALQGGMAIVPDAAAAGGRAIGLLKAGQEASAEIRAKRKQPAAYSVWIRLHWGHNVPSALSLSVGDALHWTSKDVAANPKYQWVRVGTCELPEEPFRVRLVDAQPGMKIDQILITSDPELNPEQDKK